MSDLKIGILGPADIAKRRFIPALMATDGVTLAGIAARSEESMKKAEAVLQECNATAKVYNGYDELLSDSQVDAVYIPLPPSLHFEWGMKALNAGKHVLMEKPFCISSEETKQLIDTAKNKGLVVYENYGCLLHNQVKMIDEIVKSGKIGKVSMIRSQFGFPHRAADDFRYKKAMGGGVLLDAGGYCMKIARHYMDETAKIKYASLYYDDNHDCDMFGSVVMEDKNGLTAQLSFGMDNQYKCELELWGSKGMIYAPRIFTAPASLEPEITVTCGVDKEIIKAEATDQFAEIIKAFANLINKNDKDLINRQMCDILIGSNDVSEVFKLSAGKK